MIVEHAYLQIVIGREDEFERVFAEAKSALAEAEGCRGVALFRDVEHIGGYLLRVTWNRIEDHLETFPESEPGRRFTERIAGFFDQTPQVRHFDASEAGEAV